MGKTYKDSYHDVYDNAIYKKKSFKKKNNSKEKMEIARKRKELYNNISVF